MGPTRASPAAAVPGRWMTSRSRLAGGTGRPIPPGERLARVLDGSPAPGAFSAQLSVPARDVRLTVAGAGPISFPVKAPQAKRMIACARPARFGRGEQTLTDLCVRDTWEITPDQVTL